MKIPLCKIISSMIVFVTSFSAYAARDSVGIFHRPEKVVVLVTERQGQTRLAQFFAALGAQNTLFLKDTNESIFIRCGLSPAEASCTFRFQPSDSVEIGNKNVKAFLPVQTLNTLETAFESSMGDQFMIAVTADGIHFWAAKKGSLLGDE